VVGGKTNQCCKGEVQGVEREGKSVGEKEFRPPSKREKGKRDCERERACPYAKNL